MNVTRFALAFLCMLGLLLSGCGDSDESSFGEWTVAEDSLRLTEDLRVSETEDFYFGTITALDVTSTGRMVVADRAANNIKVLRPDGSLLDTLGGPGEGPGEFQALTRVGVGARDSLYALDLRRAQITVYAPNDPYERSRMISVPRNQGFMALLYVLPDGLAGAFGSGMSPEDGVTRPAPRVVRPLDESGTPGDTLFLRRSRRMAFSFGEDGGFTTDVVPFSRETIVAAGPNGRLYSGWTDSLHIEAHTLDGESEVIASIPIEPVPVSEAARDSALSDIDDELRSMAASALPDTKPTFTEFTVADDGRIWIKGSPVHPTSEAAPWWSVDPNTKTIRPTRLPREVNIRAVQNGNAYGITTTEEGTPAVVRYRLES